MGTQDNKPTQILGDILMVCFVALIVMGTIKIGLIWFT